MLFTPSWSSCFTRSTFFTRGYFLCTQKSFSLTRKSFVSHRESFVSRRNLLVSRRIRGLTQTRTRLACAYHPEDTRGDQCVILRILRSLREIKKSFLREKWNSVCTQGIFCLTQNPRTYADTHTLGLCLPSGGHARGPMRDSAYFAQSA